MGKRDYFRFTDYALTDEERRDNYSWLKHFEKLGIPACIAKSHKGEAVWRQGAEHIAKTHTRSSNDEDFEGEIVEAVNGFQHITL